MACLYLCLGRLRRSAEGFDSRRTPCGRERNKIKTEPQRVPGRESNAKVVAPAVVVLAGVQENAIAPSARLPPRGLRPANARPLRAQKVGKALPRNPTMCTFSVDVLSGRDGIPTASKNAAVRQKNANGKNG